MKRIVFCDVDSTLLNSENKILPSTMKALRCLAKKNIPFVIISARSPSGIFPILNEYGFNCKIISYSGAYMLDENGKTIFSKGMSAKKRSEIVNFIRQNNFDLSLCIYSRDRWIVFDKSDERIIREEKIVKAQAEQGSLEILGSDKIHKILCICNPKKILKIEQKIKSAFPEFSVVKSSDILLEIMEKGVSKAFAVKKLCGILGVSPENAIAFGDNFNDEEMLKCVGSGFLMGNAPTALKSAINLHTKSNDEDGIYFALKEIGLVDE